MTTRCLHLCATIFLKKNGPIPSSFCLFLFFSHYNFNTNTNWKKHRWCAWDSNPRPHDGRHRRNHGAMAATHFALLLKTAKLTNLTNLRPLSDPDCPPDVEECWEQPWYLRQGISPSQAGTKHHGDLGKDQLEAILKGPPRRSVNILACMICQKLCDQIGIFLSSWWQNLEKK